MLSDCSLGIYIRKIDGRALYSHVLAADGGKGLTFSDN